MKACESNPNQFMHDCCEKARKWEELAKCFVDRNHVDYSIIMKDFPKLFKLRELIEKKMEWASPYKDSQFMNGYLYRELRQILEASKK